MGSKIKGSQIRQVPTEINKIYYNKLACLKLGDYQKLQKAIIFITVWQHYFENEWMYEWMIQVMGVHTLGFCDGPLNHVYTISFSQKQLVICGKTIATTWIGGIFVCGCYVAWFIDYWQLILLNYFIK